MKEILEAVSWPHVALLFAIVFIVVFRESISELIKKTKKVSKDGLETESGIESQQERTGTSPEAVQQLLDAVGNSLIISKQEENITKDLENKGIDSDQDCKRVLIRYLAGTQILLAFEKIYALVFGSQIILLKLLNEVTGQGRDKAFVEDFFGRVRERHSEFKEWDLQMYLNFLLSQLLVTVEGSRYHITDLGVEYLTWMARNGRPENRPI